MTKGMNFWKLGELRLDMMSRGPSSLSTLANELVAMAADHH